MMRNPFARLSAPPAGADDLPACRSYRSLSDAAMRPRKPRITRVAVAGFGVAALVLAGGWALRPTAHPAPHVAAAAPAADSPRMIPVGSPAPSRPVPQPKRARFQVDGVSVTASRATRGAQRIAISPGVSRAHAASVESAVLRGMITGLASTPRLTTTRYRQHHATVEHYVTSKGVTMTALCVQWNTHTAYLLRAPSGKQFTTLMTAFRPS